jgi:steroid Delta-isomerase
MQRTNRSEIPPGAELAGAGAVPAPLARVIAFYETLTPDRLAALPALYAEQACFKDPFNEVRGIAAIEAIFAHMFRQVHAPRFVIHDRAMSGAVAFLTWDFRFRRHAADVDDTVIRGATLLRFGADGRVEFHRDYWDAAGELYEKLPVLGTLMRWLRRRLQAHGSR